MELILAFDIGTSSMRTSLFTANADRLEETTAQETYPLTTTPDGGAEFPPELLKEAAIRCLNKTFEAKRNEPLLRDVPIIGVGTSCFWHSLVGVSEASDRPLTPVITWADARCREDAIALRKELDEREMHRLTGCMLRPSFWPAKLAWLRRTRPGVFSSVKRWISPAEWLQEVFCGASTVALGMATGTGLFNPSKCDWEPSVLEHLGVDRCQLNSLSDEPQFVTAEWAGRFPELASVPWYPGIGDGAASNLGSGATQPGVAAINMGTSAALRVMSEGDHAEAPFGLFCYRVDARRYLVGGAVSNAGNLRAWCLRETRLPEGDEGSTEIEAALADRPLPQHGLTVLPFWTAERAPTWREEMTGGILGLAQHTTALDILQATTEAVFYRLARIAEMVTKHEGAAPKFIVSGGILKSPSGLQRLANVMASPIYPNDEAEASIRGAAVYVAEKLGRAVTPPAVLSPLEPNPEVAPIYRQERQRQRDLEALLCERFY